MESYHHPYALNPVDNVCRNLGSKFSAVKTRKPSEERKRAKLHILRLQHDLQAMDRHFRAVLETRDNDLRRQQVLLAAKDHEIHALRRELEMAKAAIKRSQRRAESSHFKSKMIELRTPQSEVSDITNNNEQLNPAIPSGKTIVTVESEQLIDKTEMKTDRVLINDHRLCDETDCKKLLRGETNKLGEGEDVGIFCQSCLNTKGVMEVLCQECALEYGEFCTGSCQRFQCYECLHYDEWIGEEGGDRCCSQVCNKAVEEDSDEDEEEEEEEELGVSVGPTHEQSSSQVIGFHGGYYHEMVSAYGYAAVPYGSGYYGSHHY